MRTIFPTFLLPGSCVAPAPTRARAVAEKSSRFHHSENATAERFGERRPAVDERDQFDRKLRIGAPVGAPAGGFGFRSFDRKLLRGIMFRRLRGSGRYGFKSHHRLSKSRANGDGERRAVHPHRLRKHREARAVVECVVAILAAGVVIAAGAAAWSLRRDVLRRRELRAVRDGLEREIREHRESAARRHEAEQGLKLVVDSVPAVMWTTDADLRFVNAYGSALSALNIGPNELDGTTLSDYFETHDPDFVPIAQHRKALAGESVSYHVAWAGRDWLARLQPLRSANGQVVGVIGVAQDVTELRQAEAALDAGRDLLRSLVDSAADVIYLKAPDGRYQLINKAGAAVLCRTPEEMVGKTDFDVFPVEEARRIAASDRRVIETGERRTIKESLTIRGRRRAYYGTKLPYRDAQGRIVGVLGTHQDVTELTEAKEKLERTERLAALGTFAAGIAHELNNPIGTILLAAEGALDELAGGDGVAFARARLGEIVADARRSGQIIKSVLRFSQRQPSERVASDFNAVVRRGAALLGETAAAAGADVRLDLDEGLPPVLLNATEFEQVVGNLLRNAIEAAQGPVRVQLKTQRDDGHVRLVVSDDGPGIAAEEIGHIFDPFHTTRAERGGMGLGLSVVHGIVEAHRGHVDVASAPGAGATFTIELPIADGLRVEKSE